MKGDEHRLPLAIEGGICHHEFGNLIVYNAIIWTLVIALGVVLWRSTGVQRTFTVDGVRRPAHAQPFYGQDSTRDGNTP